MKKNIFDIFKEMNEDGAANGTATLGLCNELVEAKKTKNGGHVTIGVPEQVVMDMIFKEDKIAILLVVDEKAYNEKLKKYE